MPKGFHHLTYEQRCQISVLLKRGDSQGEIAKAVNIDQSSISREIKRNSGKKGYRYKQANQHAKIRREIASSKPRKVTPEAKLFIEQSLRFKQWSPEQISGAMEKNIGITMTHEWIYLYIWNNKKNGGDLYKHLRRRGKKYNKRGNKLAGRGLIPNRVGIENRPAIVDLKERVGDFELDTIVGQNHQGAIVSMVDRRTKLTKLRLIKNNTAEAAQKAICQALLPIKNVLHTLTSDNGKEFAKHVEVAQILDIDFYFAQPYHSWERGLNENTNGLVRQYFPKKTDFTKLNDEDVLYVEHLLNSRPRKSLNYKSPIQVFLDLTANRFNYAFRA